MLLVPIIEELEPGRVWTVAALPTVKEVRAASANDPKAGYWRGNYHVTRYRGTKQNHFKPEQWLLSSFVEDYINSHGETVRGIKSSRTVTEEIIGEEAPWTFPAMARKIVRWLSIGQQRNRANGALLPEWHYQYCRPFHSEYAAMYDLDAAYWQMAERARSPIFDIVNNRIIWRSLTANQEERWNSLLTRLAPYKLLRLAIIGACSAGWSRSRENWHGSDSFRAGELCQQGDFPSPLQPLALMAVRATYEVTQIQSDRAQALYSNADCVVSETAKTMEYWDECALRYKKKAEGAAQVHAVGAWKIGSKQTGAFTMYETAHRYDPHLTPFRLENTSFHGQFLLAKSSKL